ncbi:MAG: hypothetical protein AAFV53_13085 [Myxococcota bacterium]
MNAQTIQTRAQNGARILDLRYPGWADRIDVDSLDFPSIYRCVLGQVFETYHEGMKAIWGLTTFSKEPERWRRLANQNGFDVPDSIHENQEAFYFDTLTAEWKRLVRARQEQS